MRITTEHFSLLLVPPNLRPSEVPDAPEPVTASAAVTGSCDRWDTVEDAFWEHALQAACPSVVENTGHMPLMPLACSVWPKASQKRWLQVERT